MWFFNKKTTIKESGILHGATDYHSHILPGVDDGVETIEESLHILAAYEELGIKEVWLTPHIMEDIPNTPERLKARFAELQAAYKGDIKLHLAAEYMIDNHFQGILKNKELLPICTKGNHLLVETSYFSSPIRLHETLKQIKTIGFYPILAHPERYMYMGKDDYRELHEEGVRFQLNTLSLGGYYGNTAKKKAEWLLKERLYTVAGSDLHSEDAIGHIALCELKRGNIDFLKQILKNNI